MAIARGAGTEIIRSHHFEAVESTSGQELIIGVQYHIYTVLSVILWCDGVTAGDYATVYLTAYDSNGAESGQPINLFKWSPSAIGETFVWNDKFSFNGGEPTDFTGAMNSVADQDLIVDQAVSTSQKLLMAMNNTRTKCDVTVTFIDQNNA